MDDEALAMFEMYKFWLELAMSKTIDWAYRLRYKVSANFLLIHIWRQP